MSGLFLLLFFRKFWAGPCRAFWPLPKSLCWWRPKARCLWFVTQVSRFRARLEPAEPPSQRQGIRPGFQRTDFPGVTAFSFCALYQGNLDWHGNPSWFSGLQDESNFQTKISHKWLEILVSFFHIMKIWYFGLHLALVTCYYPNLSKNGSHLKKSVQKFEFCCWAKLVNFQHF